MSSRLDTLRERVSVGLQCSARPVDERAVGAPGTSVADPETSGGNEMKGGVIRIDEVERRAGRARPAEGIFVRPLRGSYELERFATARRRAFGRVAGSGDDDAPLDAVRRFATHLGAFDGERLVGGIAAWRLSESFCSVGYLLAGAGIERLRPSHVVEVGSLFVDREHRAQGVSQRLFEAVRVLLAGMAAERVVAFAVESDARRYVERWGFTVVGGAAPHPFAPETRVVPLVASLADILGAAGEGVARVASRDEVRVGRIGGAEGSAAGRRA